MSADILTVSGGTTVALNDLTITGATAGALHNLGTLTLTNTTFSGNTNDGSATGGFGAGGAIDNGGGGTGTLTVTDSTFSGNVAGGIGAGGAISNGPDLANFGTGTLTVTDSTFSGNTADGGGGAIDNGDSTLQQAPDAPPSTVTITGSTFSDNRALCCDGNGANGGAIDNGDNTGLGTVTVADSTFSGNTANNDGGAIDNGDNGTGTLTVLASTFSGNTADVGGAHANAIDSDENFGSGTTTPAGDVFADGCTHNGSSWTDEGYNVGSDASCFGSPTGPNDVNAGPGLAAELGPLADNGGPTQTMALLAGNPAIGDIPLNTAVTVGSSTVSLCPGTDQRGFPRPDATDQACDSGAYELGQQSTQLVYTGPTSGDYGTPVTLTAKLTSGGRPVGGQMVSIGFGAESCSGTTSGSTGIASCTVTPTDNPGTYPITARFAGAPGYLASSDSSQSFTVLKAPTTLTAAPASFGLLSVGFSAKLTASDTGNPIAGRTIVFSVSGQKQCQATTDNSGVASCAVFPALVITLGPSSYIASFAGDADYQASSGSGQLTSGLNLLGLALGKRSTGARQGAEMQVTLSRGRIVYATGSARTRHAVVWIKPRLRHRLIRGRYTLTLRIAGSHRTVRHTITLR